MIKILTGGPGVEIKKVENYWATLKSEGEIEREKDAHTDTNRHF